jgi:hypothetical protein
VQCLGQQPVIALAPQEIVICALAQGDPRCLLVLSINQDEQRDVRRRAVQLSERIEA